MVDGLLEKAPALPQKGLRALIAPHAGLVFSGPTAAHAYKQLAGLSVETVILLGPSHYASFEGASIPDVAAYETPLGEMLLSPLARELAGRSPFVSGPQCKVQRPSWWRKCPKEVPPFGEDTPHTWEHSLEVQLPFLQKVAPEARIVPIVFGQVDPQKVAEALAGHIGPKTIVVASSDLSHFKPYRAAKQLDAMCIAAVLQLDVEDMKRREACGKGPILALMHLARRKGWRPRLLDYRNSGDTAGDKARVVGYAAIAFYQSGDPGTAPAVHTSEERKFLLELARKTVTEVVRNRQLPDIDVTALTGRLAEKRGCFVTLNRNGRLRGCIGHILPQKPLYYAVMENSVNAALRDKRFGPVRPEELGQISIEISILTVPQRLEFASPEELLAKLRPRADGVVLRLGSKQATYLPGVWKKIPRKEKFLSDLSRKAGLGPDAWRQKSVTVHTYQAEVFEEAGH